MKLAAELTRRQMLALVTSLQELLFTRQSDDGRCEWVWDKEWNADTLEAIGFLADQYGLWPELEGPACCTACGRIRVKPGVISCRGCAEQARINA
jgi:hypothetical protein